MKQTVTFTLGGRIHQFGSGEKLGELIARTPTRFDLAAEQALEADFDGGRGGICLELTAEHYRKLKN